MQRTKRVKTECSACGNPWVVVEVDENGEVVWDDGMIYGICKCGHEEVVERPDE